MFASCHAVPRRGRRTPAGWRRRPRLTVYGALTLAAIVSRLLRDARNDKFSVIARPPPWRGASLDSGASVARLLCRQTRPPRNDACWSARSRWRPTQFRHAGWQGACLRQARFALASPRSPRRVAGHCEAAKRLKLSRHAGAGFRAAPYRRSRHGNKTGPRRAIQIKRAPRGPNGGVLLS